MVSTPFAPLLGQTQAVELLTQAIARNRIAPAYLFVGPDGIGRRLAAQCFLELLLVSSQTNALGGRRTTESLAGLRSRILQLNHPDLLWVEPTYLHQGKRLSEKEAIAAGLKRKLPPQIRLEQVREVAQFLSRPPLEANRSVVILEQAETMAEAAANALLKTLEEPGQATLILIAPGVESLLPTLVSRCQRIPFYRLNSEVMAHVLTQAGHPEILQHPEILALAQGSPGEAIAHWQQLQTMPEDLLHSITQLPSSPREALNLARQIAQALDLEAQIWLIDYLAHRLWQTQLQPDGLQALEKARQYLLRSAQPRLVWEVTLLGFVRQADRVLQAR